MPSNIAYIGQQLRGIFLGLFSEIPESGGNVERCIAYFLHGPHISQGMDWIPRICAMFTTTLSLSWSVVVDFLLIASGFMKLFYAEPSLS
jgi:hypothetical protein